MDWSQAAAVVSAVVAAVAALISLWQAYEFRGQVRNDRKRAKLQTLMDISPIYSDRFIDAAKTLQTAFPDFSDTKKITQANWEALQDNLDLNAAFGAMVYHWDRVALAYKGDLVDRSMAKSTLKRAFMSFAVYFEDHLPTSPDGSMQHRLSELLEDWRTP